MYTVKLALLLSFLCVSTPSHYPWSKVLKSKIENTVSSTFQVKEFSLHELEIDFAWEQKTLRKMQGNLYLVNSGGHQLGYVFVDQAESMKNVFDFVVVFSEELEVMNTKVLIYREQHGKQIGAKRWLDQFVGMTTTSNPQLGKDIDGISGATISVNNMTVAMNELLQDLKYLETKGLFDHD